MRVPDRTAEIDLTGIATAGEIAQTTPVFNNAAAPNAWSAAPVQNIQNENRGRVATAQEGIEKVDMALAEIAQRIDPEANAGGAAPAPTGGGKPSLSGQVLTAGAGLVLGAVFAPHMGPALNAAAKVLNAKNVYNLGSSFSSSRGGGTETRGADKSAKDDFGYGRSQLVAGTKDYAAAMSKHSIGTAFGNKSDIAAFDRADTMIGKGPAAIKVDLGRVELMEQSLDPETVVKNLEDQRALYVQSLQNAGEINMALNGRRGGIQLNSNTAEAALKQDQTFEDVKRGVVFNV